MRLTNDIRDRIIHDIMADIPVADHENAMLTRARQIAVERLPPAVRAFYNGPNKDWIGNRRIYICCVTYYLPCLDDYDSQKALGKAIEEDEAWAAAHKARDEQRDRLKTLRRTLRDNINTCSTRKQFLDRFPELAKYAPSVGDPVANLPATKELVGQLQSAGLVLAEAA